MKPSQISSRLRHIAQEIDADSHPSRMCVARSLKNILISIATEDEGDEVFDPIISIIEGASELGLSLNRQDIIKALKDTGLEADDISLNQPIIPAGVSLSPGVYVFYKGGETNPKIPGFVTDDPEHAATYGLVHEVTVECTGNNRSAWSFVHDWDGHQQLVPPGPECSKVNDDSWLIIRPCKVRPIRIARS